MFDRLKATAARLRTFGSDEFPVSTALNGDADGASGGTDAEQSTHLFECQACESVYIATDKETCADCGGAVTRIQSTDGSER